MLAGIHHIPAKRAAINLKYNHASILSRLMAVILLLSAFQMIALGIIGEYVWRTFDASRNRPNFVIDQLVEPQKLDKEESI